VGRVPPFRQFEENELDFLAAQAALGAAEARTFSGKLDANTAISMAKFEEWFRPSQALQVFSFCEAMEIINEIWSCWNSELQRHLPGVDWNGRSIHGFISGAEARAFLASSQSGTFLVRFGSTGGLTVDVKSTTGRLEKKNITVNQLRERSLQRWLHEMDGADALKFLHVPHRVGHAPPPVVHKSDCFPQNADRTGYVEPEGATFGVDDVVPVPTFTITSGYENVSDENE